MDDGDGITSGSQQFLSPTGRIWTVRATSPDGTRIELTSDELDGEHGAVMDVAAVARMLRIDHEPIETVEDAPAEPRAVDLARI